MNERAKQNMGSECRLTSKERCVQRFAKIERQEAHFINGPIPDEGGRQSVSVSERVGE